MKVKPSKHVVKAKKIYNIENMVINKDLEKATGCKIEGLQQIMKKGQGAYFTGSRPGQTPTSWGYARLASAITGGKSAAVDFHILEKYCNHKTSKAYKLGLQAKNIKEEHVKFQNVLFNYFYSYFSFYVFFGQ